MTLFSNFKPQDFVYKRMRFYWRQTVQFIPLVLLDRIITPTLIRLNPKLTRRNVFSCHEACLVLLWMNTFIWKFSEPLNKHIQDLLFSPTGVRVVEVLFGACVVYALHLAIFFQQ